MKHRAHFDLRVSILFLLEGASNLSTTSRSYGCIVFQSFFCWKGHQIKLSNAGALTRSRVSILFLLEGASNLATQPTQHTPLQKVSILFLLEGASNPYKDKLCYHTSKVSILFLLEGASNQYVFWERDVWGYVSILFLLEGASNQFADAPFGMTDTRFNPFSAGRGIKSESVAFRHFGEAKVSILFLLEGASNQCTAITNR